VGAPGWGARDQPGRRDGGGSTRGGDAELGSARVLGCQAGGPGNVGLAGGARGCARTRICCTAARLGRAFQTARTHAAVGAELERAISGDPAARTAAAARAAAPSGASGRAKLGSARRSSRACGAGLGRTPSRRACLASGARSSGATSRGAASSNLGIGPRSPSRAGRARRRWVGARSGTFVGCRAAGCRTAWPTGDRLGNATGERAA
jgi:hypothetical protein